MAPRPPGAGRGGVSAAAVADPSAGWRAWHLVYHQDRDRLLRELVAPLAAGLLRDGDVAALFLVRYDLGGPHVRLRLRPRAGRAAAVDARVRAEAAAFLARAPSDQPLPDETVRLRNAQILPTDPLATPADDVVLPDNSLHAAPPGLEAGRYGGARLLRHSLRLFTLSTLDALRFFRDTPGVSAAARLSHASRALVRYAWGFARDGDEFVRLLGHAEGSAGEALARFARQGDQAFERRGEPLCALVREELAMLSAPPCDEPPAWTAGPAALVRALGDGDDALRWRIAWSHMHMTANRLGLLNPEEVYLGRMLVRAAQAVAAEPPWREAWDARRAPAAQPAPPLGALMRQSMERFAAGR